jgi:hypothetical protein
LGLRPRREQEYYEGQARSRFCITLALLAGGLVFAGLMGSAGGLLPALREKRIPIARALREI